MEKVPFGKRHGRVQKTSVIARSEATRQSVSPLYCMETYFRLKRDGFPRPVTSVTGRGNDRLFFCQVRRFENGTPHRCLHRRSRPYTAPHYNQKKVRPMCRFYALGGLFLPFLQPPIPRLYIPSRPARGSAAAGKADLSCALTRCLRASSRRSSTAGSPAFPACTRSHLSPSSS